MELALTPGQMAAYRTNGFIQVPNQLTGREIDTFLEEEAEPKPPKILELGLRRHTADPQWRYLASHPRVTGIATQLLGGPPMIVQTMYMAKAPRGGTGIALHQDAHYIRNEPGTLMACWLALSDTDRNNGGLCVAAGSHLAPLRKTRPPEDSGEHASWVKDYAMRGPDGKEWSETMHSHEVTGARPDELTFLTVPRGSGVYFTGGTIHGSYANRSIGRPRLAFAIHYVREGTWVFRCDIQDLTPVA
jgi:ectoine hydroxylase-related dioxygenase (phytanoyl-CoA dioxygenase family)